MTKHTPGPLEIGIDTDDEVAQIISADGQHFARIEQYPILENANRLIVCWNALEGFDDPTAAPDLLEAAKAAEQWIKPGNAQNDLRAAINKAEGKE